MIFMTKCDIIIDDSLEFAIVAEFAGNIITPYIQQGILKMMRNMEMGRLSPISMSTD